MHSRRSLRNYPLRLGSLRAILITVEHIESIAIGTEFDLYDDIELLNLSEVRISRNHPSWSFKMREEATTPWGNPESAKFTPSPDRDENRNVRLVVLQFRRPYECIGRRIGYIRDLRPFRARRTGCVEE